MAGSAIAKLLYLVREERFVSTEPIGSMPPGEFLRVTAVPAPGGLGLLIILVLLLVVYGIVLAFATWRLGGRPLVDPIGPALLVTANGAIRACLKVRERRAAIVGWHEPVGRESWPIRIGFGLVGLVMAGGAGWWLATSVPGLPTPEAKILAAAGLGVLEGVRNVVRIGGTYAEREFRLQDFQTWFRLEDR